MKVFFKIIVLLISLTFFLSAVTWSYFGPVGDSETEITVIVPQNKSDFNLSESLFNQKLIKNQKAFNFLHTNFFKDVEIKDGGYKLTQSMNTWQVLKKLTGKQDLFWVNVFFCPRKEQVGEKLASVLSWNNSQLNEWNNLFRGTDYFEGVYYPDTYLIPADESVKEVSQRFINRFNEKFAPLQVEYVSKNIKWTTGLKIASLIAREAAGREDAKTISAVIWNRLDDDMRLQIDATMQYTLGKNDDGSWWGSIDLEQKQLDSPYNSYKNKGLPPTPICSPSFDFIEAALHPEESDCLYYLHGADRQIHCAKTYTEHRENIIKYLN